MTYNVFGGTLNLAPSQSLRLGGIDLTCYKCENTLYKC